MHLLMIDDRIPDPDMGYGYCRAHRIVQELLTQGHHVTILPLQCAKPPSRGDLDIRTIASLDQARDVLPRTDAIWLSRLSNLRLVRRDAPELLVSRPWLYDCEALHSTRNTMWAALGHRPLPQQVNDVAVEAALWSDADVTIAAARKDAAALTACGVAVDEVVGHVMTATAGTTSFRDRSGVLFLGSFLNFGELSPNWDAIRFLVVALWPALRALGTTLTIAGHDASRAYASLGVEDPGIRIESDVPELRDVYDRHRVVLAPTRFASGIPWKLHEAFGFGVPAVVSTVLAAQMVAETPHHSDYFARWSATTPDEFIRAVSALYRDEQVWQAARRTALDIVGDSCGPGRFSDSIERCVTRLDRNATCGSRNAYHNRQRR